MSRRPVRLYGALLAAAVVMMGMATSVEAQTPAPTPQVTPTDGCCAKCIGKTTDLPYTYDPVIHTQCSAAKGVCCYNCGQDVAAQMTVTNADFGADGVTPEVKAGEWAIIQWANVARVTYEMYQATQKKTTTVRNGSLEARLGDDGLFYICAKTHGFMYARGWGADPCLSATKENRINILNGTDVDSCGRLPGSATVISSPTNAPTDNTASSSYKNSNTQAAGQQDIEETCNNDRASIIVRADGTKECVCAAEWSGPPSCGGYPWWKVAVTIGGAIAAALSIVVSAKAYLKSHKANAANRDSDAMLGSVDDIPIVSGGLAATKVPGQRKASHEGYEQHRESLAADKAPPPQQQNREFSL